MTQKMSDELKTFSEELKKDFASCFTENAYRGTLFMFFF